MKFHGVSASLFALLVHPDGGGSAPVQLPWRRQPAQIKVLTYNTTSRRDRHEARDHRFQIGHDRPENPDVVVLQEASSTQLVSRQRAQRLQNTRVARRLQQDLQARASSRPAPPTRARA